MLSRKKKQEEARLQAELEARVAREEAIRKARKKERTASWQKVSNGIVPVARPAEYIQLTPIVQPIPLVPYSSQRQPLAMYVDDEENYDEYDD